MAGMRVSIGIAWFVIVAAEMVGAQSGIGYFIWNEWNNLQIASMIVAIVLIALVLRGTSWENKLTLLIVAAFAAATYALKDVDLVTHGLAVAAYGLAALVAIWLVHCLLTEQKRTASFVALAMPSAPPAASAGEESTKTMQIDDDNPKPV